MPEFDTDFDVKNKSKANKKRDYSIRLRYVLKTVKKDKVNTIKTEGESSFVSEIRKIRQMARELGISMKIPIGKMG